MPRSSRLNSVTRRGGGSARICVPLSPRAKSSIAISPRAIPIVLARLHRRHNAHRKLKLQRRLGSPAASKAADIKWTNAEGVCFVGQHTHGRDALAPAGGVNRTACAAL